MRAFLVIATLSLAVACKAKDPAPLVAPSPPLALPLAPAPSPGPSLTIADAPACDFTIADCTSRCEKGDHVSCYRLGRLISHDFLVPAEDERSQLLFHRACDAGVGDACNAVGVGIRDDGNDLVAAVPWFERGCRQGSAKSCLNGGLLRDRWRGVVDPTKARELFEHGCTLEQAATADICFEYGGLLERSGERDAAIVAFRRSCKLGWSGACTRLAKLAPGAPAETPTKEEVRLRRKAECDDGGADACFNVGAVAQKAGDLVAARAAFERGCALAGVDSCMQLGTVLVDGAQGFAIDQAEAARASRIACTESQERRIDLGLRGCRQYADRLARGEGVPKDEAAAAALYIDTCRRVPPFGCSEGAAALMEGRGIEKDEGRGMALLTLGCAKRDDDSCKALKARGGDVDKLHEIGKAERATDDVTWCERNGIAAACANVGYRFAMGRDGPTDPERAASYLNRACKGGNGRGCALIVRLGERVKVDDKTRDEARERGCALGEKDMCK